MIREATEKDRLHINKVATHPLQSWEWGEFRKQTGVEVSRFVVERNQKITEVFQVTWHKIPLIKKYIGYCPKSTVPSKEIVEHLKNYAKKKGALMIKFEPNETKKEKAEIFFGPPFVSGKPLFTKFTFELDITKSEEELFKGLHQKTRYNVRLAEKRGVEIKTDNSPEMFEEYWKLTEETTKRQGFYAHTKNYHKKMFELMVRSGMGQLITARFQGEVLTAWIIFILNKTIYYPYGASSTKHREVMANNLVMWEVIKFGKKLKCEKLDMWGSLGPQPDVNDPWFGFHKFKQGYGANLIEFLGTYDLVVEKFGYQLFVWAEKLRWVLLRAIKKIS